MKEFRSLVEHKHVAVGESWSRAFNYEDVQFKYLTIACYGIAAASLPTYLQVNVRAGDVAVNVADIAAMRRATGSGTGTLIVIDFPLTYGLEIKVLPVSAALDLTIYGSNS